MPGSGEGMIVLVETTETAKNRKIRISVRNLVEFVLRGGDIDSRQTGSAQKNAMEAGSRIHRKI